MALETIFFDRSSLYPLAALSKRNPPPLDDDVLAQIFQEVKDNGSGSVLDLRCLSLVSRQFNRLTTPLLYSRIEVHAQNIREITILFTRLLCNPRQCHYVRAIKMWSSDDATRGPLIRLLRRLAPNFGRLDDLYWAFSLMEGELMLMGELRLYRPKLRLHLDDANVGGHPCTTLIKQAGQYIRTIDAWVPWNSEQGVGEKALFWAIYQCPNLEKLSIQRMGWAELYLDPGKVVLEEMRPLLKDLTMHDIVMSPANLLQWGEWGGWEQLRKLYVRDLNDIAYFKGCEETLESITIFDPTDFQLIPLIESYRRFKALRELTIIMTDVKQHPLLLWVGGHQVDSLRIHTFEDHSKTYEFHVRIQWGRE